MSDPKTVPTPEQIAELKAARAAIDGPFSTASSMPREQAYARDVYLKLLEAHALALLDAAERCGELERDVAGFSKAVDAANAVGRVHYDMLTTATRERDEMARELERAREAMKKLHPRPSHGLLGDIGCVADRVGSNSDAWEELLRERDAASARAEAAEEERDEIVSAIIGHDDEDMKHDLKSVAQLVKDVLVERDDLARRLGEAEALLRSAIDWAADADASNALNNFRAFGDACRGHFATLTTPPADGSGEGA